jgi:hypothetical protein
MTPSLVPAASRVSQLLDFKSSEVVQEIIPSGVVDSTPLYTKDVKRDELNRMFFGLRSLRWVGSSHDMHVSVAQWHAVRSRVKCVLV